MSPSGRASRRASSRTLSRLHYNDIESTERILRENADDLSCVIIEPVLSNFGYLPADGEYLARLRELTTELGLIFIFDEVQSFRLSQGGAQEQMGVIPDMTTFGKVIGGGMPVGAWGGRADLMDLFDPTDGPVVSHAGTFNANPMTMVAGLATLDQLTLEVYERMDALGDMLRAKLRAVFGELDIAVQVTGVGSLFGVHFTEERIVDHRSVLRADRAMQQQKLFTGLLNEGILMQTKAAGCVLAHDRVGDRRSRRRDATGDAADSVSDGGGTMTTYSIDIPQEKITNFCRERHIRKLSLFGSALRNDFSAESDVDVLVEFEPGHTPGLVFFAMQRDLSELMGSQVDLNTANDLDPSFRRAVLDQAQVVYGREERPYPNLTRT